MALEVETHDNKFRVVAQEFQSDWMPDTAANRKVMVIVLRGFQDENGKPLFTLQELAAIVESDNRQAASAHVEDFRNCGGDFRETLKRKQKVDDEVVGGVREILRQDPLCEREKIARLINERLGWNPVPDANASCSYRTT